MGQANDAGTAVLNVKEFRIKVFPVDGAPYTVAYGGREAAQMSGGGAAGDFADVPVRIGPDDPRTVMIDSKRLEEENLAGMALLNDPAKLQEATELNAKNAAADAGKGFDEDGVPLSMLPLGKALHLRDLPPWP